MTAASDPVRDFFRYLFCPEPLEKQRREKEAMVIASEAAGTLIPWGVAATVGWAMISLMTGWNIGFF
ncbi:MAG: hypothetical protein ACJAYU_000517 [Bradymonadia bacterium]|jgi:hypothetical protein